MLTLLVEKSSLRGQDSLADCPADLPLLIEQSVLWLAIFTNGACVEVAQQCCCVWVWAAVGQLEKMIDVEYIRELEWHTEMKDSAAFVMKFIIIHKSGGLFLLFQLKESSNGW